MFAPLGTNVCPSAFQSFAPQCSQQSALRQEANQSTLFVELPMDCTTPPPLSFLMCVITVEAPVAELWAWRQVGSGVPNCLNFVREIHLAQLNEIGFQFETGEVRTDLSTDEGLARLKFPQTWELSGEEELIAFFKTRSVKTLSFRQKLANLWNRVKGKSYT